MDIYGGLLLKDLLEENKRYDFQLRLFQMEIIQGIQVRVDHPSYTPSAAMDSVKKAMACLPEQLKLFIHLASDSVSFDPGQQFDNLGLFTLPEADRTKWEKWNLETVDWGFKIADAVNKRQGEYWSSCSGVVHPGHGKDMNDNWSYEQMLKVLQKIDGRFALEATYALIDGGLQRATRPKAQGMSWRWKGAGDSFWSFGGTPDDMAKLLNRLGPKWRCLIDFSHLMVTAVQATMLDLPELRPWQNLEKLVQAYMDLSPINICHFSGAVKTPYGNHDGFGTIPTPLPVLEGLRQMKTICLEIPWNLDKEEEIIRKVEGFCNELS